MDSSYSESHGWTTPFVDQVCFVADQDDNDIAPSFRPDLLNPPCCVEERLPICTGPLFLILALLSLVLRIRGTERMQTSLLDFRSLQRSCGWRMQELTGDIVYDDCHR